MISSQTRWLRIGFYVSALIAVVVVMVVYRDILFFLLPDEWETPMVWVPQLIAILAIFGSVLFSTSVVVKSRFHERELKGSQEKFAHLYKSSPVPYVSINEEGRITLVNLAAIRLFGVTEKQLLTLSVSDLLEAGEDGDLTLVLGKLKTGVSIRDLEIQVNTASGGLRWVLLSVFNYGPNSERLVSLVDITHQKEVEAAKSEFVSLASHQLRTPIAAIRWNLELFLLAHDDLTEEQNKYYVKIERNVIRMINLINDFLNVSKLELGTFAAEKKQINLTEFCNSVFDEFEEKITKQQLAVEKHYNTDGLTLNVDRSLIHIVISNLVSNAVKYTPNGGTVSLTYEQVERNVVIEVKDTGMGIPKEEVDNIFRKFFRASNARANIGEGTGLGLYIVKKATEMLGGTISMTTKHNEGTVFTVSLPL